MTCEVDRLDRRGVAPRFEDEWGSSPTDRWDGTNWTVTSASNGIGCLGSPPICSASALIGRPPSKWTLRLVQRCKSTLLEPT